MHEIKQAVNYMGPELLLRNAPPPPASNFVHFYFTKEITKYTKENMQAERFGSNFSLIGLINIIS